mmetsp:Transcript_8024/g.19854  ORF Transcript_8024/g.19854 Transcript_8024/m.19854 type:complete len:94 (-) Transcript_8024:306-587(-)
MQCNTRLALHLNLQQLNPRELEGNRFGSFAVREMVCVRSEKGELPLANPCWRKQKVLFLVNAELWCRLCHANLAKPAISASLLVLNTKEYSSL